MSRIDGRLRRTWKRALGGSVIAFLLVLDMLANGMFGGSVNETISSRLGRMKRSGSVVATALCAGLDVFDRNHCADAAAGKGG